MKHSMALQAHIGGWYFCVFPPKLKHTANKFKDAYDYSTSVS